MATIYYFSATGNSLWTARELAARLEHRTGHPHSGNAELDVELVPILTARTQQPSRCTDTLVGFVFPMYAFGIPDLVVRFIEGLDLREDAYIFGVVTKGFPPSAGAVKQLRKLLASKDRALAAGFYVRLIDTYLPGFEIPDRQEQAQIIEAARAKIGTIATQIQERASTLESGALGFLRPFWYGPFMKRVHRMDEKFFVLDSCNSCKICSKVCPVDNIEYPDPDGPPRFKHQCQQCYACVHHCPKHAIQIKGKAERRTGRYRHPEVKLKDIIAQKPKPDRK